MNLGPPPKVTTKVPIWDPWPGRSTHTQAGRMSLCRLLRPSVRPQALCAPRGDGRSSIPVCRGGGQEGPCARHRGIVGRTFHLPPLPPHLPGWKHEPSVALMMLCQPVQFLVSSSVQGDFVLLCAGLHPPSEAHRLLQCPVRPSPGAPVQEGGPANDLSLHSALTFTDMSSFLGCGALRE